jgi:hypothetical protein
MEYPCHRCGALVEEGTRFCPACSAPQIRVLRPEPEVPVEPRPWQLPEDFASPESARPAPVFQWQHAWPAVMFAGATMGALSALPLLALLFPVWMILSGTLAVSFYLRRTGSKALPTALGARLGALSGLMAWCVYALFTAGTLLMFGSEIREQMRQLMSARMQSAATDPQSQALMQWFLSPQGMNVVILIGMVFFLFGFVLLGMGAGAFWARSRTRRAR